MFGLGTILNTLAVIVGSGFGMLVKRGLQKRLQDTLLMACGVATMFIGAAGTLAPMLVYENGQFSTQGGMLLVLSFVFGGLIGEWINIELRMDQLGEKLKQMFHAEKDNRFVEGFVSASLVICIGAMAIVGSIQDGISGSFETLAIKSILDLVLVAVYAASFGVGVMCSAIPIFVYQGSITLVAHLAGNFIPDAIIADLSFVGSALIFCVGINVCFGKKIRVGNLLPALMIPVVWYFFK